MRTSHVIASLSAWPCLISASAQGYERVQGSYNVAHGHGLGVQRRGHNHNHHSRSHLPQFQGHHPKPVPNDAIEGILKKRATTANVNGQCGPNYGSCADGVCCSPSGWCGTSEAYCAAPDCLINYGPGCDSNQKPPGDTTSTVTRTKPTVPNIVYGAGGVYSCTVPGTVALTYDDGPYLYTANMLDLFDKYKAKATFFITGNNLGKGPIDNPSSGWDTMVKRMYNTGHQIASHTWAHQDLSTLTTQQLQNAIYYNEMAFRNILGFFPIYMRPPYSSCNTACQNFLAAAGYHVIYFDLDTSDYLFNTPVLIQNSKDYVTGNLSTKNNLKTDSYLVVGHDIDYQESYNLTEFMLQSFTDKGFKMVTVGECLGDPVNQWYYTAGGAGTYASKSSSSAVASASASAQPSPTAASSDGSCGPTNRRTCLNSGFGNCCSSSGWCGATSDYCGTSCQSTYGLCGSNSASQSASSQAQSAAAASIAQGSNSASQSVRSVAQSAVAAASGAQSSKASGIASAVVPLSTITSTSGQCGKDAGLTCLNSEFGNCCSVAGYCGKTSDYCGDGCQPGYGVCGSNSILGSVAASVAASGVASTGASGNSAAASGTAAASGSLAASKIVAGSGSVAPSGTASAGSANLTVLSNNGQCGSAVGLTCLNSGFGNCCSGSNWCGSTADYCGTGCQAAFGLCGSNSIAPSVAVGAGISTKNALASSNVAAASSNVVAASSNTGAASGTASAVGATSSIKVSTSGQCGKAVGMTCSNSAFGDCCSSSNYCGKSTDYCGTGCQSGYGICDSNNAAVSVTGQASKSVAASSAKASSTTAGGIALPGISTDDKCGPSNKKTCLLSQAGSCCSKDGECGASSAHCETGCQLLYGLCGSIFVDPLLALKKSSTIIAASAVKSSANPAASSTGSVSSSGLQVSTDGSCGGTSRSTCQGSQWGSCCSSSGWCGSADIYCGSGCQSGFGTCASSGSVAASAKVSSISSSSMSGNSSSSAYPSTSSKK